MSLADPALYQAILQRHSTRRYDPASLDASQLDAAVALAHEARPLVADNDVGWHLVCRVEEQDVAAFLGRYGRLIALPHLLVPHLVGGEHALMDLGFRGEQVAVHLERMGIATCFLGALSDEPRVVRRYELAGGARIGAALVFGRDPDAAGHRAVNALFRRAAGGTGRLPLEQLCYDQDGLPAVPPARWIPLIEAARWAPSARNAQPWRFQLVGATLGMPAARVCTVRQHRRYGGMQDYRWFDVGACLANLHLAAQAEGRWLEIDLSQSGREVALGDEAYDIAASVRYAAAAWPALA